MTDLIKTVVKIDNLDYNVSRYLNTISTPTKYGNVEQLELINRVFKTNFEWNDDPRKQNWPSNEFIEFNLGTKFISMNDVEIENDTAFLTIESEDNIPLPFLKKILNTIKDMRDNCDMNIIKTYKTEYFCYE